MDFILETLKRHTWKLAVGGSAAVLLAGVNLVDGKTTWWAPLVAFAGLVIVLFLSTNAGVVIKIALVVLLVMALVSVAVMSSSFGTGVGGVLWGVSILALAFACLSYSYLLVPFRSRWNALGVGVCADFAVSLAVSALGVSNMLWVSAAGWAAGAALFYMMIRPRSRKRAYEGMPVNYMGEREWRLIANNISAENEVGLECDYRVDVIDRSRNKGGVLAWSSHLFYIHPVSVNTPFGVGGKKLWKGRETVSYGGRDITPWVERLMVDVVRPASAGLPAVLVVLDMNRRAAREPRTLTIPLADSRRRMPVLVIPASKLDLERGAVNLVAAMEDMVGSALPVLTSRQVKRLSALHGEGAEEEDEDGEETRVTGATTSEEGDPE